MPRCQEKMPKPENDWKPTCFCDHNIIWLAQKYNVNENDKKKYSFNKIWWYLRVFSIGSTMCTPWVVKWFVVCGTCKPLGGLANTQIHWLFEEKKQQILTVRNWVIVVTLKGTKNKTFR